MSIVAKAGKLEFWKPALMAPLFLANLPAAAIEAIEKINDAISNGNPDVRSTIPRKKAWARSVQYYDEGKMLHQVDKKLYRGSQPGHDGFADIAETGIRTVVNLRRHYQESQRVESLGMQHIRIGVNTLTPSSRQIVEFLRIATDPANQPVFVHCLHGADRTGMMCAAYRVVVQQWTIEEAMEEWLRGPFGFHKTFNHLKPFFRSLDFEELRRQVYLCNTDRTESGRQTKTRKSNAQHI